MLRPTEQVRETIQRDAAEVTKAREDRSMGDCLVASSPRLSRAITSELVEIVKYFRPAEKDGQQVTLCIL